MLKLKHLFENYDLAKKALEYWNYDKNNLDNLLSKFRISSNAIYPFSQDGKVCFLRLAPIDEKREENITGELEFLNYLVESKFPALKPIKTKKGELLIKISTEWGCYYATAFRKVSGIQIDDTDFSDSIMLEYGKTLGKLHSLSSGFCPNVKKWTHIEVLYWIRITLLEYNAKYNIISELNAIIKELDNLPIHKDNYGLIHYDFELDNVFYDEDTKTCSVIDFDDSMYHWYALDIEKVFGSLEDKLEGNALEVAKKEFIEGYISEHCYTNEMDAIRPLMKRFIDLYSYARVIRCIDEKFDNGPEWLIDLCKVLDNIKLELETSIMKY